jgi:hypothetical protein
MSERSSEAGNHGERAPADPATAGPVPLPETTPPAAPSVARYMASAAISLGPATTSSPLESIHSAGNRALAEVTYQLQRIGTTTLAGAAAIAAAIALFIAGNLPQVSAIRSLRTDLERLSPLDGGRVRPGPTAPTAASLPPRADAPRVVEKILEEADASGIELPRGQYEYIPPRDGMAARYRMTFPVHATYPKIREFMDRTMVALPAVAIEGLRIERKTVGDDSVEAELKLSAYVRSDP